LVDVEDGVEGGAGVDAGAVEELEVDSLDVAGAFVSVEAGVLDSEGADSDDGSELLGA
jgi:hypothetical protein